MPRKYNLKPITQIKHDLIARCLKDLGKHLYPRELKLLKSLFKKIDDLDFWRSFSLDFKFNTFAFLNTEKGWEFLQNEYKKFKFKPIEKERVEISDRNFFLEEKKVVDKKEKVEDTRGSLKNILKLW